MPLIHRGFALIAALLLTVSVARAQGTPEAQPGPIPEKILQSVVKVTSKVPADARTAATLGTEREGSGVVIDDEGLVLTIGYLILESSEATIETADGKSVPAKFIAYDHATGFGLLRATAPLGVDSIPLGSSADLRERTQVLVASYGGARSAIGAYVVGRRDFTGSWEYLLEQAIFTAPPHLAFGGAALISTRGRLVGIGSLIVQNAMTEPTTLPGNMFIPIDKLKPILAELLEKGRSMRDIKPWLGLYPEEVRGRVFIIRVPPEGPAFKAGIRPGDLVLAVDGTPVRSVHEYYRRMWALGGPGTEIPLTVLKGDVPENLRIKSIDRYQYLKMWISY